MAGDTQTTHYLWIMPEVGGAPTTWGTSINQDLQDIDKWVFAANQGVAPVGSILMFGGVGAPVNWHVCDGSLQTIAGTYQALFNAIGYKYSAIQSGLSFNLPNLQGKFPLGVSSAYNLAATGGEEKHALAVNELAAHAHTITPVSHTHTLNAYNVSGTQRLAVGTGSSPIASANSITTSSNSAGPTATNSTGAGVPHNNMPPFLVLNFIIRFQ